MNKKGFTLIELLIVVAIIGIIAAIAIPNLLVAMQKGKQKSTMGDMKTLGTGIESYVTDWSFVPQEADIDALSQQQYFRFHAKNVPVYDAWGTMFQYETGGAPPAADSDQYSITSWGRNKAVGGNVAVAAGTYYEVTSLTDFNNDIVYSNGNFTFGPKTRK